MPCCAPTLKWAHTTRPFECTSPETEVDRLSVATGGRVGSLDARLFAVAPSRLALLAGLPRWGRYTASRRALPQKLHGMDAPDRRRESSFPWSRRQAPRRQKPRSGHRDGL